MHRGARRAAAETPNVKRPLAAPSRPLALPAMLALALATTGCSSLSNFLSGDKVDYRSGAAQTKPLEVPPDLTQLSRDRRAAQAAAGGTVSASSLGSPGAAAAQPAAQAAGGGNVAITARGDVRVERQGDDRWLVVPAPADQVWPQVRAFWLDRGFTLATDNAEAGVLETDWAENRAALPQDLIRRTIGRFLDRLYDTGTRDRFRVRVERGANGTTEVYVTHRGLEEVYADEKKEATVWRARPRDLELESEMLTRLMVKLGTKEEAAKSAVATAPKQAPRARVIAGQPTATLEVDEGFDRAWRRVGLALDRSGFTVEDRDRTGGVYFVRYVDTKAGAAREPGFFSRLFGGGQADALPVRYRVAVAASGDRSRVTVLSASGAPDNGPVAQRIAELLAADLK